MRYPPSILDEIRARLPVSEVVGKRVLLKKAGREWKGLSPFNAEKSPSFFVNDQKGFYHCFSSGKHGDIFDFLMETEGLSFPETVERLASEAGVQLPKASAESVREEKRRAGLHEIMEMAAAFFSQELSGRRGTKAREYVERRELDARVIERFRIGYAPADRFALRDHLAGKNVSSEAMIEAGLLVTGDDIAVPYDRFRDRVMFPICDIRGRVVAFGGRALSADVPAKYLNSPDTPLFHKGTMLYNAHLARKAAHEKSAVVAVEGYMDVIALARMGIHHAVAPLGTALTEDQLGALWRMADEPILCFDGDKAGRRAAFRALDTALPILPVGKSLRFAILPEGRDPDDIAREGGGAPAMNAVLEAALPLVDVLWARELEAGELDTPEQRAAFERRLRQAVRAIKDETLQRYYRDEIEARLSAQFAGARRRRDGGRGGGFEGARRGGGRFGANEPQGARLPTGYRPSPALLRSGLFARKAQDGGQGAQPREAMIVSACVAHPHLLGEHAELLAGLELTSAEARAVLGALLDYASEDDAPDPELVRAALARAGLAAAVDSLADRIVPSLRWILDGFADSVRVADALRQAIILHRRAYTLHSELKAAERALAEDDSEANLAWMREVRTQLSSVEGAEADREDG
ncbi:MAG: DNA primase [Salinarimonadaceae bacterium]|nr:MAG: DNA primase [Salinarimonadaceae bacterium]